MNAIVNTAPGRLEWKEWPTPEPGPSQVRVRTVACGICATDLEMIAGWKRTGVPSIPGHEWSGVVEAVGPGVGTEWLGRAVVGDNHRHAFRRVASLAIGAQKGFVLGSRGQP